MLNTIVDIITCTPVQFSAIQYSLAEIAEALIIQFLLILLEALTPRALVGDKRGRTTYNGA